MRGGTYEELLYFLQTRELPKLNTYFSNCSQDTKDTAVALFKNEHDPSTLVKKLNSLMPSSVAVFGNPPAASAPSRFFQKDYDDALYVANYTKTTFPDAWKQRLNTKFETPEEYALDDATRRDIIRKQPRAQFKQFVQPPPGTYGGV